MITLEPVNAKRAAEITEAVIESLTDLEPWMPWASSSCSIDTAEYWINEIAPKGHEFFIIDEDGRYLGNIGINAIRLDNMFANLGYWIRSTEKGKGYATMAVQQLVSWVRENTDINRLEIVAAVDNTPSRRVAEKSGAFYEGIAKQRLLLHSKYHDAAVYSLTKNETID